MRRKQQRECAKSFKAFTPVQKCQPAKMQVFSKRLSEQAFKSKALYQELAASKSIRQAWQKQSTKRKRLGSCRKSKNAARTWQRWLRKQNAWGSLYWADIPMQNPRTKGVACARLPFLLPHEWVAAYLQQPGAWEEGQPEVGSSLAKTVEEVCAAWKRQPRSMFSLGLRGDRVPVQGNLRRSRVDFLTINLPGGQKYAAKRVPVSCLETKYNAGQTTTQAILEVLAWSLKQLGKAEYPKLRHDGGSLGKARAQKAGVRIKPAEWRAMTSEERKSKSLQEWVEALKRRKKEVSPLFAQPGISNASAKPDWRHVADEGSCALAAGQVLSELLSKCEGSTKEKRAQTLWTELKAWYEKLKIPACRRLKRLTLKDIVKPGKAPDLDAKSAEVRDFCTLALEP